MKEIRQSVIALLAAALVCGCASFGGQKPTDTMPVLTRTLLDDDGQEIGEVQVSFAGGLYGRGCQWLTISAEGDVDYLMQQDASSDYSVVRGLVAVVPETVAVVMNPVTTLLSAVIVSLGGALPMSPPSDIHGCDNLMAAGAAELEGDEVLKDEEPAP